MIRRNSKNHTSLISILPVVVAVLSTVYLLFRLKKSKANQPKELAPNYYSDSVAVKLKTNEIDFLNKLFTDKDHQNLSNTEIEEQIIFSLNRAEGQVRGIERMVLNSDEPSKILNQVAAAQSALHKIGVQVWSQEVKKQFSATHTVSKNEKTTDIENLIKDYQKYLAK